MTDGVAAIDGNEELTTHWYVTSFDEDDAS